MELRKWGIKKWKKYCFVKYRESRSGKQIIDAGLRSFEIIKWLKARKNKNADRSYQKSNVELKIGWYARSLTESKLMKKFRGQLIV